MTDCVALREPRLLPLSAVWSFDPRALLGGRSLPIEPVFGIGACKDALEGLRAPECACLYWLLSMKLLSALCDELPTPSPTTDEDPAKTLPDAFRLTDVEGSSLLAWTCVPAGVC